MIQLRKNWLAGLSWEEVETIHRELCQGRQLGLDVNASGFEQAKAAWKTCEERQSTLYEVLELCRQCLASKPFVFMNANTMTTVARKLLEGGLAMLPPVEAQIIRTTISHYVAGQVPKKELEQVLKHFEKLWVQVTTITPVPPAIPLPPRELSRPAA